MVFVFAFCSFCTVFAFVLVLKYFCVVLWTLRILETLWVLRTLRDSYYICDLLTKKGLTKSFRNFKTVYVRKSQHLQGVIHAMNTVYYDSRKK